MLTSNHATLLQLAHRHHSSLTCLAIYHAQPPKCYGSILLVARVMQRSGPRLRVAHAGLAGGLLGDGQVAHKVGAGARERVRVHGAAQPVRGLGLVPWLRQVHGVGRGVDVRHRKPLLLGWQVGQDVRHAVCLRGPRPQRQRDPHDRVLHHKLARPLRLLPRLAVRLLLGAPLPAQVHRLPVRGVLPKQAARVLHRGHQGHGALGAARGPQRQRRAQLVLRPRLRQLLPAELGGRVRVARKRARVLGRGPLEGRAVRVPPARQRLAGRDGARQRLQVALGARSNGVRQRQAARANALLQLARGRPVRVPRCPL
mmetsp:Transcript_12997/g.31826  ORF Transcript_12997/g.31826 Transcript_12997/m.31826 type:complete len:313 (+) Transcript_12997:46-984(+)